MPKAQHGKGRFQPHSKKGKVKQRQAAPMAAAQEAKPVAPAARPAAKPAAAAAVRYPYVAGELRRAGILAGIIIAILVVLALILS